MRIQGRPVGVFDLNHSDFCVGSYLIKDDLKEILQVEDSDLTNINFEVINNIEVADERQIQKMWYECKIPNAIPVERSSLDELILIAIIRRTFPKILIERQIKFKRYTIDLKLTLQDKSTVYIEFDGPSHFVHSRWGMPNNDPFKKKKIIEDETGIEVVNWPYWIQRCECKRLWCFVEHKYSFWNVCF
jgi:hypothetical protein